MAPTSQNAEHGVQLGIKVALPAGVLLFQRARGQQGAGHADHVRQRWHRGVLLPAVPQGGCLQGVPRRCGARLLP